MYPKQYFDLFPSFPRNKSVFVAMGFDAVFDSRWDNVIKPAIEQVEFDGVKLKAERVDTRNVSDSILTEIEDGISACLLVFVDITCTAVLDGRPIRNGNVMYELGLAHAIRRPEEVLIFRSDNEQMLFDTANCRALSYDPDGNSVDARSKLTEVIDGALSELDLLKNKTVEKIAGSIDGLGFAVLAHCSATDGFRPPPRTTR